MRNRFKGLDLTDRVPDELWMEVRDIVQETRIKTIHKKKKCKKAKWLPKEALQRAVKRREVKSKGEKERYTHFNAEFQRIARRDEKAFLNDQCKEIEENNRMGKIRDLFWRRQREATPVLLPRKSHGWRSLARYRKSLLYSSSVYYCHLFLISSASVRSLPFLSFIEPIFSRFLPFRSFIEPIFP